MTPQTLTIDNYGSLNIRERSRLNADAAAAQADFTPENTQGFAAGLYAVLGGPGIEDSDLKLIDGITDGVVTAHTDLERTHSRFESITVIFGNQLEVFKAAYEQGVLPADSDFAVVGDPIAIDPDQKSTTFTDPDGGPDWWYKFVYRNEASSTTTSLADSTMVRGGNLGNYCSIDDIRREAGLGSNRNITDATIDKKRQAAQMEVNGALSGLYTVPFAAPINPLIAEVTRMLAAGMLLLDSYGPVTVLNSNNGQQKVDAARALLLRIDNRELILTDPSGNTQVLSSAGGIKMWPDTTTKDAAPQDGGGERAFRVSDIQGYESRRY